MIKRIIVLTVLLILVCPLNVLAQNETEFASVVVDLWPEFDRPSMLVIYHITLSPKTVLPIQLEMRIPSVAGAPHAVAVEQPDGSLISVPNSLQTEGDWTRVIFKATTPEIQLEYYDPRLMVDGSKRRFVYSWNGDYSVEAFGIDVQRPIDATSLQIIPGMAQARQGADGLTYYNISVGSLSIGQGFEITLTYIKENNDLSVNKMSVGPSAPLESPTQGITSVSSVLPWALGTLGIVLIVGGIIWYAQSGKQKNQPKPETHRRRRQTGPMDKEDQPDSSHIYCSQCGKRASEGDHFCRVCGTPLRTS